ncbi:hypothetical protein [Streptomyces sp. bgisy154]|uniref:hypothetical protein n=1 Tax=Streptomyces sp. bgisy154 TaxID=3413794 RepID=UPI003D762756
MARQPSSSTLPRPVHGTVAALRRLPGAGVVGRVAEGTLDTVGKVSPRGRRLAVYTGAGLLGVMGVVEWPVAMAGAAVAWLTQARPGHPDGNGTRRGAGPEGSAAQPPAAAPTGLGGTTTGGVSESREPAEKSGPSRTDSSAAGRPTGTGTVTGTTTNAAGTATPEPRAAEQSPGAEKPSSRAGSTSRTSSAGKAADAASATSTARPSRVRRTTSPRSAKSAGGASGTGEPADRPAAARRGSTE